MDPKTTRALTTFTIVVLVLYAPIETWASLPNLLSPYYLVDFIAMVLLTLGVVHSRRLRPLSALAFMAAGWGWLGANGWRATADRFDYLAEGGSLTFGAAEMCFVICGTIVSIVGMMWCLVLAARASRGATVVEHV